MSTIERRSTTVTLYPASVQRELDELMQRAGEAYRAEEAAREAEKDRPRRQGQKSDVPALAETSMRLAVEYDEKLAAAEGVEVVLHEISRAQWREIEEANPPREGNAEDAKAGLNLKTFREALVRASLGDTDLDIDELSQLHYKKLENEALTLHGKGDELPKGFSLVSWLATERKNDSVQPSEPE
jgi:hypothetical protein